MHGFRPIRFFARSDVFFGENAAELGAHDWKQLHFMSILYMGYLVLYLLAICISQGDALQMEVTIIALVLQAVYTCIVYLMRRTPTKLLVVEVFLWVFATFIMAFAIAIDDFVSVNTNGWVFLVAIILMTQIYTLPPRQMLPALLVYILTFVVCAFANKAPHLALLDTFSAVMAISVAVVAYVTIMEYKMSAAENSRDLARMCSIDAMTGMLNKTTFEHYFNDFLSTAPRAVLGDACFALAIIDLDDFKTVNDRHGHIMGDDVLRTVAAVMRERFGDSEEAEAGRFGGDEFVILIKSSGDKTEVEKTLRSFKDEVHARVEAKFGFALSCSIGVVLVSQADVSFADIFLVADRELYDMKETGRDAIGIVDYDEASGVGQPIVLAINLQGQESDVMEGCFERECLVLSASGALDAINSLERYGESISAIIMDYSAQKLDAGAILEEVSKVTRIRHPAIVVIADEGDDLPQRWRRLATRTVKKPVDAADFDGVLRESSTGERQIISGARRR